MKATRIILPPGVTIGRNLGYIDDLFFAPVITDGLLAWHNLGVSLDQASRNWAPGQPDAVVAGMPMVLDGGELLMTSLTNYLQSDAADTTEFTWFAVARTDESFGAGTPISALPVMISNYTGGPGVSDPSTNSTGSMLWWMFNNGNGGGQASRRAGAAAPTTGAAGSVGAVSTPSTSACYMLRCTTVGIQARNLTAGTQTLVQSYTDPRFPGSRKLRIGSAYQSAARSCAMANAVIYDRPLDETEISAVYGQLQEYQLRRWGRTI